MDRIPDLRSILQEGIGRHSARHNHLHTPDHGLGLDNAAGAELDLLEELVVALDVAGSDGSGQLLELGHAGAAMGALGTGRDHVVLDGDLGGPMGDTCHDPRNHGELAHVRMAGASAACEDRTSHEGRDRDDHEVHERHEVHVDHCAPTIRVADAVQLDGDEQDVGLHVRTPPPCIRQSESRTETRMEEYSWFSDHQS